MNTQLQKLNHRVDQIVNRRHNVLRERRIALSVQHDDPRIARQIQKLAMARADIRSDVVSLRDPLHVTHAGSRAGQRFLAGRARKPRFGGSSEDRRRIRWKFFHRIGGDDGFDGRRGVGEQRIAENHGVGVVGALHGGGVENGDELIDKIDTGDDKIETRDAREQHIHRSAQRTNHTVRSCRFEDVEHVKEDVSKHETVFALRFLSCGFVGRLFVTRRVQRVVVLKLDELR